MTPLADKLHQQIAQQGALRVDEYMQQCLLDKDCGYYSTKTAFGAEGDFITAPEVSQIFGEMLAAFHAHLYHLFQKPETLITFEAGPGRGTLLQDMRRAYQMIKQKQRPYLVLQTSFLMRLECVKPSLIMASGMNAALLVMTSSFHLSQLSH